MTQTHAPQPLADTTIPDTFGPMTDWIGAQPPRRSSQKAALTVACVVALAACTVPVSVETELGRAISWTAQGPPIETARQSETVIGWVGDRPLLGFRVERVGPDAFAYRLAVADATADEAAVWRDRLAEFRDVRSARAERVVEERRRTLVGVAADRLDLFQTERRPRLAPAVFIAETTEIMSAHGYQTEMVEVLPPHAGEDEPRWRVRMRMPDGSVETREI